MLRRLRVSALAIFGCYVSREERAEGGRKQKVEKREAEGSRNPPMTPRFCAREQVPRDKVWQFPTSRKMHMSPPEPTYPMPEGHRQRRSAWHPGRAGVGL